MGNGDVPGKGSGTLIVSSRDLQAVKDDRFITGSTERNELVALRQLVRATSPRSVCTPCVMSACYQTSLLRGLNED